MNWKPGPARCRSDELEARIFATDGGGEYPIMGATRSIGSEIWCAKTWDLHGLFEVGKRGQWDLLPPKLSRDEVAMACLNEYGQTYGTVTAMRAALDHYDHLRKEGLCDE